MSSTGHSSLYFAPKKKQHYRLANFKGILLLSYQSMNFNVRTFLFTFHSDTKCLTFPKTRHILRRLGKKQKKVTVAWHFSSFLLLMHLDSLNPSRLSQHEYREATGDLIRIRSNDFFFILIHIKSN